jgi:Flp pilus assembly protein TadG
MARAPARTLALLLRDTRGATVVEFAAVAPVLLMVVLGLMDLSYNLYAATLLEGAILG